MEIKVRASADGAYADVIQPPAERDSQIVGEPTVVSSTAIAAGEELTLKVPSATDPAQIEVGDVVTTPEQPAAEEGGTPEPGEPPAGEGGEQPPVDDGGGTPEEPPTTTAASEKPLYLVSGDTVPDGFTASGLETPDGKTLYHFAGDTAGQSSTGNVDPVSVYAEADDNEKPVQAVQAADAPSA